ncbi:MAG: helix-turn-helix transcriptional regulator [Bacilli bacterium]|nr:helix-turn-helix transcriptional regulator [Bacilli bacterium]
MSIADRIQSLRKTKGISQEELADKIGVSRQSVSKWESEQSIPDLDKVIIMSDYFEVTTDYILKGIETPPLSKSDNFNTSQVLYVASTAFLVIGLLCAFGGWNTEQSAESIWGSMIIQVIGLVAYFIGKIVFPVKVPLIIKWLNIIIVSFMPLALVINYIFHRVFAPYPIDLISGLVFVVIYMILIISSFLILKKIEK